MKKAAFIAILLSACNSYSRDGFVDSQTCVQWCKSIGDEMHEFSLPDGRCQCVQVAEGVTSLLSCDEATAKREMWHREYVSVCERRFAKDAESIQKLSQYLSACEASANHMNRDEP